MTGITQETVALVRFEFLENPAAREIWPEGISGLPKYAGRDIVATRQRFPRG